MTLVQRKNSDKNFVARYLTIIASVLFLISCSVNPSAYNSRLVPGMSLSQVRSVLYSRTYVDDDPFLSGCYRTHIADKNMGIVASSSRKAHYVFKNQPTLSNLCGDTGSPGEFVAWFDSYSAAMAFIDRSGNSQAGGSEPSVVADNKSVELEYIHGRLRLGMEKIEARFPLMQLVGSSDPFQPNCFRLYNPNKGIDVLAGSERDHYYVFDNVSIRSSVLCDSSADAIGDGTFSTILNSMNQVRAYIAEAKDILNEKEPISTKRVTSQSETEEESLKAAESEPPQSPVSDVTVPSQSPAPLNIRRPSRR